jgi:AcrR family transcriptional regulator
VGKGARSLSPIKRGSEIGAHATPNKTTGRTYSFMTKGEETRERILDQAFRLAARDGLEGLSLSALATEIGMSKSGLFAHFKSKEALQLEVLKQAEAYFESTVWRPALKAPRGEPRLQKLFELWLTWADRPSMPGGCLFMAASIELDDREGAPRDLLVHEQKRNLASIAKAAQLAIDEGHFARDLDCEQFAFEMNGIVFSFNHYKRLLGDRTASKRAHKAFQSLLERSRPTKR